VIAWLLTFVTFAAIIIGTHHANARNYRELKAIIDEQQNQIAALQSALLSGQNALNQNQSKMNQSKSVNTNNNVTNDTQVNQPSDSQLIDKIDNFTLLHTNDINSIRDDMNLLSNHIAALQSALESVQAELKYNESEATESKVLMADNNVTILTQKIDNLTLLHANDIASIRNDMVLLQSPLSSDDSNMQPYTTVNYIIALDGAFPSRNRRRLLSTEPFLGQIRIFAGNFAPRDWAVCDGQLWNIAQNTA